MYVQWWQNKIDVNVYNSPLCLVWVQAPYVAHKTSQVLLAGVWQVAFLGVLLFSSHLLIGPSHMSRNNLERDMKLNKNLAYAEFIQNERLLMIIVCLAFKQQHMQHDIFYTFLRAYPAGFICFSLALTLF